MPIDYTKYQSNWFTEIRPAILKRAGNKCEICGVKNYSIGYRNEKKEFIECDQFTIEWAKRNKIRTFKIILTIAHLNHDVNDNRESNLKALCQLHHLQHDQEQHILTRKINAAKKRKKR